MDDPGTTVIGAICSDPVGSAAVVTVLVVFTGHFGFSITSAMLKKYAIQIGWGTKLIRFLAIDVKPPASKIVSDAAKVVAATPTVVASTGIDPSRMVAAANAIKATE